MGKSSRNRAKAYAEQNQKIHELTQENVRLKQRLSAAVDKEIALLDRAILYKQLLNQHGIHPE